MRRSSSGALSRKAYGLALRISCASGKARRSREMSSIAPFDAFQQRRQSVEVHRFGQAIIDRLLDERMFRDHAVASDVFKAGQLVRKDSREQVFRLHPLQWRRVLRPPRCRGRASARVAFHRSDREHRSVQESLDEDVADRVCMQKMKNVLKRERMLGSQESTMASSVAAACSSKLNERQNRFRRASPQARLMRTPNGECTTSCMPPDSSKKRSSTSRCCDGIVPSAR